MKSRVGCSADRATQTSHVLQIFLKYLLSGRHGLGTWDRVVSKIDKKSCPCRSYTPAGETEIVNVTTEHSATTGKLEGDKSCGKNRVGKGEGMGAGRGIAF